MEKKGKKTRKIWDHKSQNSVKMSNGMFCERNLLEMATKKMEKKSRKTQNHKTQKIEKRFAFRIFSKCQREKWKESEGKF